MRRVDAVQGWSDGDHLAIVPAYANGARALLVTVVMGGGECAEIMVPAADLLAAVTAETTQ